MKICQYAIIDGASEPELFSMLDELNPPVACLYAEPIQAEVVKLAPYLVVVTDPVKQWLDSRTTPWGIYCSSYESMNQVRQHFRKYLQAMIPQQDKPVFFRFYDPRVIWDYLESCTAWDLHCFMGPIDEIATYYNQTHRQEAFSELRQEFPQNAVSGRKLHRISELQYASIQLAQKRIYLQKLQMLAQQTLTEYHPELVADPQVLAQFIPELFEYLVEREIDDIQSVEGVTCELMKLGVLAIDKLPTVFIDKLSDDGTPGWYRANKIIYNLEQDE